MKLTLLPILFLVLNNNLFSQANVWMIPIEANDLNLRLPAATVLDSITIDCPSDGKVFVRFDGNCTSTPGDRIILAASNVPNWDSNDGNTSVTIRDSFHTIGCFDHARNYNVVQGTHTFYAVGHNFVELEGNGFASIKGHLTVEFVPNNSPELALSGLGFTDENWIWNDSIHVFPQTSIEALSDGQLAVNLEGFIQMPHESHLIYTTNLEPTWPTVPVPYPINLTTDNNQSALMHRQVFPVAAGHHDVFGMVNILSGDLTSLDEYFYCNLSAQFIPSNNPDFQLKSQRFDHVGIDATGPELISQIQVTTEKAGKVWLQFTGQCNSSYDDRIKFWLRPTNQPDSILSDITLQPIWESTPDIPFSLSGIQDVIAGTHTYDVMIDYDSISHGTLQGNISGLLSLQFIANGIPSKVNDFANDDSFSVFPNPTTGKVYINSTKVDQHDPFEITILNSSGQQISHQTVSDLNHYNHDLSNLPDGEYLVQIKQGQLVGVKTVMKTK